MAQANTVVVALVTLLLAASSSLAADILTASDWTYLRTLKITPTSYVMKLIDDKQRQNLHSIIGATKGDERDKKVNHYLDFISLCNSIGNSDGSCDNFPKD